MSIRDAKSLFSSIVSNGGVAGALTLMISGVVVVSTMGQDVIPTFEAFVVNVCFDGFVVEF